MRTFSLLPLLFSLGVAACAAAPSSNDASDVAGEESAMIEVRAKCAPAAFDRALVDYKKAVAGAKGRQQGRMCEEGTSLFEITTSLQTAVTACAEIRNVVATSPWAKPVREELKGNLALPLVTGTLQSDARLTGLAAALANGATVFGPAPGVLGNMSKLTFASGNAVTWATISAEGDTIEWVETRGTYRVDGATVKVTIGGRETVYDVTLTIESALPEFTFRPRSAGDELSSLPSECEA